jgi:uncharacterized protein YndB with AHSA1/START domain
MKFATRKNNDAAFTLAEVLAALLFLAIVIPTAVEALRVASLSGEVAARKGAAARVADRVLNENLVTTNWNHGTQTGTATENGIEYRWTLKSQGWPAQSALSVVTTEVKFSAQGKEYSVTLNTLANPTTAVTGMNSQP